MPPAQRASSHRWYHHDGQNQQKGLLQKPEPQLVDLKSIHAFSPLGLLLSQDLRQLVGLTVYKVRRLTIDERGDAGFGPDRANHLGGYALGLKAGL